MKRRSFIATVLSGCAAFAAAAISYTKPRALPKPRLAKVCVTIYFGDCCSVYEYAMPAKSVSDFRRDKLDRSMGLVCTGWSLLKFPEYDQLDLVYRPQPIEQRWYGKGVYDELALNA